jgi:hypothetical protein
MMRKILLLVLVASAPQFVQASPIVRFVAPTGLHQKGDKLPPAIEATFPIRCYQKFLQVIRNEIVDPVTRKVTISIGGLISENPVIPCGSIGQVHVPAGSGYSGRDFEVIAIEN